MISVIFSSFNGQATIGKTLEAFCGLIAPPRGWKLIVVDNGSTDQTAVIAQSFKDRLPLLLLSESRRGKNFALNQAIDHAEGELVVFTDDDVMPAPDWLCNLRACALSQPAYGLFGGPILPRWPKPPPPWVFKCIPLGMVYAITDPEQAQGEIPNDMVWGPNMAVRRSIFDQGLRFQTQLGPDGSEKYIMGSETELTRRLAGMGVKAWFCKEARVEHLIRENQLDQDWVLKRFFRHGRSSYIFEHQAKPDAPQWMHVERWLYRKLVSTYLTALFFRMIFRSEDAFRALTWHFHTRGKIFQAKLAHLKQK